MDGNHSFGCRFLLLVMILRINKSDYGKIIDALLIASELESDANKKRLFNLTRKKISRQNEIRKTSHIGKNPK